MPKNKDKRLMNKKGVKQWLERFERMKFNQKRDENIRVKRRAKSKTTSS